MTRTSYTPFNIVCLFAIGFFIIATVWEWRTVFVFEVAVDRVPVVDLRVGASEVAQENIEPTQDVVTESIAVVALDESEVEVSESEKSIPKEINLPVPFTSQAPEKNWDQPWQDACEEAAVLMFDAYYGEYGLSPLFAKDEIQQMVDWEEVRGWGGSIEIEKVRDVFEAFKTVGGATARIIENPTISDIKVSVAAGHPVLVVADGKVLPNPYFQNGGPVYHALIVRGYTETEFITNDPGTQFGENFTYSYNDLMGAIRDWNGGDVNNGRQVVMVIER